MAEKPKKFVVVFNLEEKLKERPRHKPAKKTAKQAKVTGDKFMRKALEAQSAGRLSVLELGIAENCVAKGLEIPEQIRGRVYG